MSFDIRNPIGLLFTITGVLLTGEGLWSGVSRAPGSAGLQVNIWCGIIMIIFGSVVLLVARLRNQHKT
jgi:hypothetical protein